jgi:dynamin 1-like protein
MEKLIPLINEIQEILSKSNISSQIPLPQLVVVGAQSTGKSSVLESIMNKDFLPKGQGIVTRCPIILQLHNIPKGEKEYVELLWKKGQKFEDFDQVRSEIEQQQQAIAGNRKQVTSNPIILKLYSPQVVDLTLVDLPGLTKIPVEDQPSDIEKKIRELVYAYVRNPNSIIIAVSAANTDLANSDSLQIARDVDPEGNRTIGVLTKLDLMEEGSDAMEILQGKLYKLKLGYIGVVCRNNRDKKSISEGMKAERAFFENHKVYKAFPEKMGIPHLVKTLNTTFVAQIKKSLPAIKDNIISLIQNKEFEMQQYGDIGFELQDNGSKGLFILNLIGKFSKAYEDLITGVYLKTTTNELAGGARISYILYDVFVKTVQEVNPFYVLSDNDIRTAIRNANGLNHSLLIPEMAFELLVKQQISRLQEPSIECAHQIYEELRKILFGINIPEITRFDNLSNKIFEVMDTLLKKCLQPTDQMIKNLIEIELGHINKTHPDFLKNNTLLNDKSEDDKSNKNEDLKIYENKKPQDPKSADKTGDRNGPSSNRPGVSPQIKEVKIIDEYPGGNKGGNGIFGLFGFGGRKNPGVDDVDNKLDNLNIASKNAGDRYDGGITIERHENNQFNRTYMPQVPNSLKVPEKPSLREQKEVDAIKGLISSYYQVVKNNISDSVPKTIITLLVNKSKNTCKNDLVASLYKDDGFDTLLAENSYIAQQREECRKTLKVLKDCMNVLVEIDTKF